MHTMFLIKNDLTSPINFIISGSLKKIQPSTADCFILLTVEYCSGQLWILPKFLPCTYADYRKVEEVALTKLCTALYSHLLICEGTSCFRTIIINKSTFPNRFYSPFLIPYVNFFLSLCKFSVDSSAIPLYAI